MPPILPDDPAFEPLLRWLERGGGCADALRVERDADGDRGIRARCGLRAGDVVVRVPASLVVTEEVARGSAVGRRIAAARLGLEGPGVYLAAFLLQEKRAAGSPWRAYLDALPASFRHVPVLFDDAELALLAGSAALALVRARRDAMRDEYARLRGGVADFPAADEAEYLWARLAVDSRLFALTARGRRTTGLVPVADMLNHHDPAEAGWSYEDAAGAFVVRALNDVAAGAVVRCRYGRRSNAYLLATYGFALADNADDDAALFVPGGAAAGASAQDFGGTAREGGFVFGATASWKALRTRQTFAFLRCAAAGAGGDRGVAPVSVANETAALGLLAAACDQALARFATTLAQDDALLAAAGSLSANARHAVLARRSEKRVLEALRGVADEARALLRTPHVLARRALAGRYAGGHGFDAYLFELATRLAVPALTRRSRFRPRREVARDERDEQLAKRAGAQVERLGLAVGHGVARALEREE